MEVAVLARMLDSVPAAQIEERLQDLLRYNFDDADELDTSTARRISDTLARGHLLMGRIRLGRGAFLEAATSLRRAASDLSQPRDRVEQGVARVLLGVATSQYKPEDALRELAAGIDQIEAARGALRAGEHRSMLVGRHSAVYEKAFDALVHIQRTEPTAGLLAAQLTESLRRSALARTLREGRLDLPPEGHSLLARISDLERQEAGNASNDELQTCRDQLSAVLSGTFANAYLPERVNFDDLRRRVGTAHVLSYRVHAATHDELRGHVVWTPGLGEPVVTPFRVNSGSLLEILGLREQHVRDQRMKEMSLRVAADHWKQIANALLPDALQTELMFAEKDMPMHLIVVPDGPLTILPWSALRLADGRFLIEAASIQHVPTLDFLEERDPGAVIDFRQLPTETRDVLVYLDPAIEHPAERYEVLDFDNVLLATNLGEIINGLQSRTLSGAYIAAHGDGVGLNQHVSLPGSGHLSAATALAMPWPAWTIFASCLVGRLEFQLGQEPFGMPVSCLIGGARSVIGGVIEVQSALSGKLAANVATRQYNHKHPAEALREAQLAYLGKPIRPAAPDRWAGFACLARNLPRRCFR